MTSEEKLRIIRNWTAQFDIEARRGAGIYPTMYYTKITMNPKYEPLSYYYDTEDEAISTTYEKIHEFVHRTVLAVET